MSKIYSKYSFEEIDEKYKEKKKELDTLLEQTEKATKEFEKLEIKRKIEIINFKCEDYYERNTDLIYKKESGLIEKISALEESINKLNEKSEKNNNLEELQTKVEENYKRLILLEKTLVESVLKALSDKAEQSVVQSMKKIITPNKKKF